jgi:hypothetical protein
MKRHPTIVWGWTLATIVLLIHAGAAGAATAEQACQKARFTAAAKYAACEQKTAGSHFGGVDFPVFAAKVSKCRVRYALTWAKLQAKAVGNGSTCDQPRFVVGLFGTLTDNLTGLEWERKTDDGGIHDKDNAYTWSNSPSAFIDANGTAFTTFLESLNTVPCLVGGCDWRLPTRAELQTILQPETFPCTSNPCIDTGVFGPVGPLALGFWTATTYATDPGVAFGVDMAGGGVYTNSKDSAYPVRAVRGGL